MQWIYIFVYIGIVDGAFAAYISWYYYFVVICSDLFQCGAALRCCLSVEYVYAYTLNILCFE